jgi:hypothetical protein
VEGPATEELRAIGTVVGIVAGLYLALAVLLGLAGLAAKAVWR